MIAPGLAVSITLLLSGLFYPVAAEAVNTTCVPLV